MFPSKDKIVIYGNSPKFIGIIKKLPGDVEKIISWRTCNVEEDFNADRIYIVGYNYSSYLKSYDEYMESNVVKPLEAIKKMSDDSTRIIYIDTEYGEKNYTLSRYRYAKNELGLQLQSNFGVRFSVISIPTVVDDSKNPMMHAGRLQLLIFKFAISFGIIKTIKLEAIKNMLEKEQYNKHCYRALKGIMLVCPRFSFVDRLLRVFCG